MKNLTLKDIIKHESKGIILGPILKMAEAFFDLLIPLVMKAVIDLTQGVARDKLSENIGNFIKLFGRWVENESLNYALIGGVIILTLGILGFIFTMITQYIAADSATKCGSELRDVTYQKFLSLSKQDIEKFGSGKMMTILNADTFQVQQGIQYFIRLISRMPVIIIGSLIFSLILDWQIGLVFLAIIPLILFIIFFIMRKASKQYLVIQSQLDKLSEKTSDTLEGIRVVKAFNRENYENQSFKDYSSVYKDESINVARLNSLINPLTFAIISLATIAVIFLGSFSMQNEIYINGSIILPSTIITLVAYLDQIFVSLIQLTNLVTIFTKSIVSAKRCDELLKLQAVIKDGNITAEIKDYKYIYSFENVSASYTDSENYVLKDITFKLKKGESLGIIGGTGCGKSTLINLMERFIDRNVGVIKFKDHDIKDFSLDTLRESISFVPQKSTLFKGTIRSNMKMADKDLTDEEIYKALKVAQAYDFVSKLGDDPLAYEVEEGGRNFSGGQRQRLCIARAILNKGDVIILDDSTSALDLLTDKNVRANIQKEYPNISKVIISQRVSTVSNCDLILVLEAGRITAFGKHEELLKSSKTYNEIYQSQVKSGGN